MKNKAKKIGLVCNVFSRLTITLNVLTTVSLFGSIITAIVWDVLEYKENKNNINFKR